MWAWIIGAAFAASFEVTVLKDDATIRRFHTAIVTAGHECPAVKIAFTEAETPNGTLFMVYCGVRPSPSGTFIGFPALMYRVIMLDDDAPLIVVPW